MKRTLLVLGGVVAITASALLSCNNAKEPSANTEGLNDAPKTAAQPTESELIARGHYLVNMMGCNDCHSPKIMTAQGPAIDSAHLLSGHPAKLALPPIDQKAAKDWVLFHPNLTAFVGPWGVSFAANLTSDASGIGNWTEEQFFRAIRQGKYKGLEGGRSLLPPMPWQQYRNASDDDLSAIFHYLKSTTPVENVVPATIPPQH
ncbi:MAG: diheme cytochrome c-553 [Chitinophagaceae bacterium]|nr:MAG: diheme cytochrome c-553 [Chitinophagaceae bacterium]